MLKEVLNKLKTVEKEYIYAKNNKDYELCQLIMEKLNQVSTIIFNCTDCQECILLEYDFNDFLDSLGLEIVEIIELWEKSRYCYVDDIFIYLDYDGNICTANYSDMFDYYEVDELLKTYHNQLLQCDYEEILSILSDIV